MHTHHLLLATSFFASALAFSSFSTHSDYGQPWYDDNHYRVWRRRLLPPCSHEAIEYGEACLEDGKLKQKEPPAIAHPTLGPQPYRGERLSKDSRFYKFLSKSGESLGYWSLWTSAGGDVAAGKDESGKDESGKDESGKDESGKDEKGQVEGVSDGVEKVEGDAREELKKKSLEEEKKEARGTIYHHFNTYFGPRVHKPVGSGSDAPIEKAMDVETKRMKDAELKVVDYKETRRIHEPYVRDEKMKRVEKKDINPFSVDEWPENKEAEEQLKKGLREYLAKAVERHNKAFQEVEMYLKVWKELQSKKEAWKKTEALLSDNR